MTLKIEISTAEETRLVERMKKEALRQCDPVIQEFVNCARGRFLSVAWACRDQNRAMNSCLSSHTNADSLDLLKVAYIQEKRTRATAAAAAGGPAVATSGVATTATARA